MFRKSALAMAMLGALTATNAVALGLGEIELKSSLNQPLSAEVELLSASDAELEELKVSIGSPEAFANAGIERPLFLRKLEFDVMRNSEGTPVVRVSSREVVREPFLDFLLELSWSKGRLLREYTVLVDPPLTMPAPAPALQPATAAQPTPTYRSDVADSRRSHTAVMPAMSVMPGEYGPTKRNDTLWNIAQQVRPDAGVSIEQTMLGLLRANPEAFVNDNINNLKAGYVLRVPSREDMTAITRGDAAREARAQYSAWRNARATSVAEPAVAETAVGGDTASMPDAAAVAEDAHLQLVAPDAAQGAVGSQGEQSLQAMQADLIMANEALEEQRRQGEEMSGRLSMLEEQIINMQRLIQLKDDELARLQSQTAGEGVEPLLQESPLPQELDPMAEALPAPGMDGEVATDAVDEMIAAEGMEAEVTDEGMSVDGMPADGMPAEMMADGMPVEMMADDEALPAEVAEAMAAVDAETDAAMGADDMAAMQEPQAQVTAEPVQLSVPESATSPGFVERLLENPLWLGAGGAVLALLAFFGLRRKRSVETEFQESILQASKSSTKETDSEIVATQPESSDSKTAESSLLSEFAVSDMGALKNDGEADPLAEADVYLAYGRFQQAEDLIKDALQKDAGREDLNLKLLEVFLAAKNQSAFDEHAQGMLARLENSDNPTWEKVAEMGRELDPQNPLYQLAEAGDAGEAVSEDLEFNLGGDTAEAQEQDESKDDEGLDFDIDLSFDPSETADSDQPDSMEFSPPDAIDETAPSAEAEMDSIEPDAVPEDNTMEFDLDKYDMEAASAEDEEAQGDGELADLDEVSTKLDLARAYIDMGDPDGAKSILDEVMEEGSDDQKEEARDIMAQMS